MQSSRRLLAGLLAIALAVALAGCGLAPATQGSPATSIRTAAPATAALRSAPNGPWTMAAIAQPSAVLDAPSLSPGYQCHPCHTAEENDLFGVAETPLGPIAVGVEQPPAQAVAFWSTDGRAWVPLPGFAAADGTAAVAVASNDSRIVIVGHDEAGATAWTSRGGGWSQAPPQASLLVPYAAGGMTSVAAFAGGFVAGGYRDDPIRLAASAAVWRSRDGLTWHLDPAPPSFTGGRILGMAASAGTLVAVGTDGDPNYGPAAAWRWTAATGWQRGRIQPDGGGAIRAVTSTPSGFVAVGLDGHDDGARVWTSPDGLSWTVVPDQPAFHFFSDPVRIQSVVAVRGGLVAGGWRSDAGKGSAVSWTSPDGRHWTSTWEASFSGGEIDGIALDGDTLVAAGRTGYPDWNTAAIWVRPSS